MNLHESRLKLIIRGQQFLFKVVPSLQIFLKVCDQLVHVFCHGVEGGDLADELFAKGLRFVGEAEEVFEGGGSGNLVVQLVDWALIGAREDGKGAQGGTLALKVGFKLVKVCLLNGEKRPNLSLEQGGFLGILVAEQLDGLIHVFTRLISSETGDLQTARAEFREFLRA